LVPVRWARRSTLTEGLPDPCSFYFVHSFVPSPRVEEDRLGVAEYGTEFVCAVERPPLYGVQFHPEKSSVHGLRLLENFAAVCASVGVA
jgi:glutamine amidotransferase